MSRYQLRRGKVTIASGDDCIDRSVRQNDLLLNHDIFSSIGSQEIFSSNPTSNSGLYARSGGEFVANTRIAGDQNTPIVASLASGGFVMVWTDMGTSGAPGLGVTAQVFDAAGNKVGTEIVVNSTATFNGNPLAIGLSGGRFAIEWSDLSSANNPQKIQMFDASGVKVGTEIAATLGPSSFVHSGAALSGNHFVLVSQGGAGQIFDADGAKVGGTFSLTSPKNEAEVAALSDGGFVVVGVVTSNKLAVQRFDANGTKIGAQFEFGETYNHPNDISIAGLSNGGFAMAWHSESSDIIWARAFDQGGNPTSDIYKANTIGGTVSDANVVGTADGQFLVTWTLRSTSGVVTTDIRGQVFDASGQKLGSEFLVSQQTDHPNRDHGYSDASLLASGNLIMVWQGSGPGDPRTQPYPNWDHGVRGQIFTPITTAVLDIVPSVMSISEVAIQNVPVLQLSTASAAVNATYSYQIVTDSTGGAFSLNGNNLVVTDSSRLNAEVDSTVAVTIRVTDNGGNVTEEVVRLSIEDDLVERRYAAGTESRVSNQTSSEQIEPVVTALDNGGFVVTWTDSHWSGDGTGRAIKSQLYDASGAKVAGEFRVNSWTNGVQSGAAVTALEEGNFVVTWTSDMASTGYDIKGQIFTSSGVQVGGEFAVNTTTANDQNSSDVTALAGGGFVVAWIDLGQSGGDTSGSAVRLQTFDAFGAKVGTEQLVNTSISGNQIDVSLACLADGSFVATWTDSSGLGGDASGSSIKGQRFDAAGNKLGSEFLVNTQTIDSQTFSTALALGDGFAVTWSDQSRVKVQIFDAIGNKVGGEITVATLGVLPSISHLPGDGFIISWTSSDLTKGDASGQSILAQMFDTAGNKVGPAFLVNQFTSGTQYTSDLATLVDGSVAAVWVDQSRGSSLGDVELRLLTPTTPGIFGTAQADTINGQEGENFIYALAGDDAVTGHDSHDALYGGQGSDMLAGGAGDDYLSGGSGSDTLEGGSGNDILDGGTGADDLRGGQGDDVYIVDAVGDAVTENSGEGTDEIQTSLTSYSIAASANIENLTGLGNVDQQLTGNTGANVIDGGAGADVMAGGDGNDIYIVDNAGDVVTESAGQGLDTVFSSVSYTLGDNVERIRVNGFTTTYAINLTGNGLDNEMWGNEGANVIDGRDGADLMQGFGGNDIYIVDNVADAIVEGFGQGLDTVFTSISYVLSDDIERAGVNGFSTTYAINLTGNIRANELWGNDGANLIDGRDGADIMSGYGGNDIYIVETAGDAVIELANQGLDTIFASVSWTLEHDIERLGVNGFTTTYAINLTGNELANEMWGNDGANVIDGKAGADIMTGYGGNDVYLIDNAGDVINESGIGGYDTVFASFSYVLSDDLERVAVNGGAATTFAIDLTGNVRDNEISGNNGANVLAGQGGSDLLIGYGGADIFAFTSSIYAGSIDQVADFQVGLDKIGLDDGEFAGLALGALAAGAFRIGSAAQDADDRIIYDSTTGALYFDADGNGAGAQVQFASLSNGLALTASDFSVI